MHKYWLHCGFLAPAVFVTALVPRNSVAPVAFVSFDDLVVHKTLDPSSGGSTPTSVASTAAASDASTSDATDQTLPVPSVDTTPSAVPNNSGNGTLGDVDEDVPWRNGLVVQFRVPPPPRVMHVIGWQRLSALLTSAAVELAHSPPTLQLTRNIVTSHGRDRFYIHPIHLIQPRPHELTYGDIVDLINEILLPRINHQAAGGMVMREFNWKIRQTEPAEFWELATGAVYIQDFPPSRAT